MKKYGYIVLSALFIGVTNVAAQSETTEAAIQQEYAAAKELHKRGEMIEAGNGYCNVLEHYHKTYGNESLEYAEVMQSISVYCKDNVMHQDAAIAASYSFKVYAKHYAKAEKRLSTYTDLIERINSIGVENAKQQDIDTLFNASAIYKPMRQKYYLSAINNAIAMSNLSPLEFRQFTTNSYETSIFNLYSMCLKEFLSMKKEGEQMYFSTLLMMGKFYQRVEKLDEAQRLFLEVMAKTKAKEFFSKNQIYCLKNDIIAYHLAQGETIQAKLLLKELGSPEQMTPSGVANQAYGITLNHWANVAILERESESAAKYLNRSIELYDREIPSLRQMLQKNKIPDFLFTLCLTARLYIQTQQIDCASEVYQEITKMLKQIFLKGDSEGYDQEKIWNVVGDYFNEVHRFAWEHKRYDLLYDQIQLTKYLFSTRIVYRTRNEDLYKDTVWREYVEQMDALSRNPAYLNIYLRGDVSDKIKIDIRRNTLSRQISKRWSENKIELFRWPLSKEKMSETLARQEAAIDFITIDTNSGNKQYGAFVATSESQSLTFIPLCTERELKTIFEKNINQRCQELYSLIWQPLETAIRGRSELFISTTDLLSWISFAGIETPNGTLCDKYAIRRISSIGLMDRLKENSIDYMRHIKNIFLYGGADFGLLPEKSGTTRGQGFSYLPGSKREVEEIARSLSSGWEVATYTGKEATEEQFAKLSYTQGAPCVVHVSTHGFYLPYVQEERRAESANTSLKSYTSFNGSLLRSGFALSGANRAWNKGTVPADLRDGILTGHEIANLNFSNTELVVLSACNTGLEEIRAGAVSRSLQQAFFKAGARSIITSLWEVPDKETELFMKEFYAQWMSGITLSQAFVDTQRMMRTRYPDDPEKWAGFILME